MKFILSVLGWRNCVRWSVIFLITLIILNFYGLYTNKFYLLKPDNYIFPILSIVHFTYLYVLQFKITEREYTDAPMRNLEYALYAIAVVYIFKFIDTLYILLSYRDYSDHVIPATFLPMGFFMIILQLGLILLTVVSFFHRRTLVGAYNFDNINEHIDPWP